MSRLPALLVQPPFLRLVGSHNDRNPIELCYLAALLDEANVENVVYNADYTGASKYIRWRRLFENSHYLSAAARGVSPLLDETVERIISFDPEVVVLAAADNITSWVDLGNAYVTSLLSERLRELGAYTVGVGPFYSEVPAKFVESFSALLLNSPTPSVVDVVRGRPLGIVAGRPLERPLLPRIDVHPAGRADVVMTALGCPYSCTFCFARDARYDRLPMRLVARDIARRPADLLDIGDAILPLERERLRELADLVEPLGKVFTCEVSVKSIRRENLEALRQLGVVAVKLGVESGDDDVLEGMKKVQTRDTIVSAVELIREYDLGLTAYVLLGGPDASPASAEATYRLCRDIEADDYVINVWAYHDLDGRDFRDDAHFSQALVEEWRLEGEMDRFFRLQATVKHGLGVLI